MTRIIFSNTEYNLANSHEIGGKAKNLFLLNKNGFNVPDWIVIPSETLLELIQDKVQKNDSHEHLKNAIQNLSFPADFVESLFNKLPINTSHFAVRSSAIDEDGNSNSFAGQYQTFLYVRKENLLEKIKLIWMSAFSDRVSEYRANRNIDQKNGIGIIIQKMIHAEAAGVGFGINPSTGSRKCKILSSVFGLGEGLVSGELNADTFEVEKGRITKTIVEKKHYLSIGKLEEGLEKNNTENYLVKAPSVSDQHILELESILNKLFQITGKYQDIEFAIEKNKVYLLQTRPITGLDKTPDTTEEFIVWDNSNIVESYPGITTPLTFSFILKIYEAAYRQFLQIMGVSQKEIDSHEKVLANMLGLIDGRVYYNLKNWYKILALLPGYSLNAPFMEKMMGVKERFELKDYKPRKGYIERIRIAGTIFKVIGNLLTITKQRNTFFKDLNQTLANYNSVNFENCSADELIVLYDKFETTLLKKWKAPLVNDFFAMIYFGLLQKMIAQNEGPNSNLHNDLLCGSNDIISTEPIKWCLRISKKINESEKTKNLFVNREPEEIWNSLKNESNSTIFKEICLYIEKFGDRSVGELKLESITYKQNPLLLIEILKEYVSQGIKSENYWGGSEKNTRIQAEEFLNKNLSGLKKILFRHLLKKTRDLVSNRENLRFERTRAFGIVRSIFSSIGSIFFREGIIENPRDIYYLNKNEIVDFIQGTSTTINLKSLIKLRKDEFSAFKEKQIPSERIKTYGMVYHGNKFEQGTYTPLTGELKGMGCSPGRVKGRVRIVKDVSEISNMNGEILTTMSTDPGWVNLFPTASAILVERGSQLSHAAIVTREMGIPCIVGINGLLNTLKTGDMIEMDGNTGEIKILNNN